MIEKVTITAIDNVTADVTSSLKDIILSSAKTLPSNKTKNLSYFYHCAVGQRNDLTHNLDVHYGMTNSTGCTVKIIEYSIKRGEYK